MRGLGLKPKVGAARKKVLDDMSWGVIHYFSG